MLKDWSKLEKILLFGSITTISLVSIIFKSDLLHTICSILIIISTLLVAKGKNLGNIVGIIATIIYSIVSYINRFYGEVIICLVLIVIALMQSKEDEGASGTIVGSSSSSSFYEKNKGRTAEGKLKKWTIILGVTFALLTLVLGILYML